MLNSPELLFYARELALLSGMLPGDELILKLIASDQIINRLSELHRFAGIFGFIELYLKYADPKELSDGFENHFPLIIEAALSYGVMDKKGKARAEELLTVSTGAESLCAISGGFPYSEPIEKRYRHERDREIYGYYFKRIASDRDLRTAGQGLGRPDYFDNVFYRWRTESELYAVHTKNSNYIAVLEVENSVLLHVHRSFYARYNDSKLLAAILPWMIEVGVIMGKDVLNES